MIDLTLDSLTVPGIPDYTPPFGTQKDPLVSLSTVETNNNIIKPFTAQRAVEFSHDETLSRIERNAVLVYTGDTDAVLDMSNVTTFKGNEIKIVNTTNRALTVKYLEMGEVSYSAMNLTENSVTLTADSTTTYSVKVSVESESITTLWTGTKEQFDAIPVKDSNTLYNIIDDVDEELIQDEKTSPLTTWSSEKIDGEIFKKSLWGSKNIFKRTGRILDAEPGLFTLKKANKLLILGNSFTSCSAWEGYEVSDGRGMGATMPQKDYKHRVRTYLRENYNPDFEVYFVSINYWEVQTPGSRNFYSSDANVYKVTDKGHELYGTFSNFKTEFAEEIDAVFVQAYENLPSPNTADTCKGTILDFIQLFFDMKNAFKFCEVYQWYGMWFDTYRTRAIAESISVVRTTPVFCPAFSPLNANNGNWDAYKIPIGDKVYDADGNLIYTIPSNCPQAVLDHPNDTGHGIIAATLLYSLFCKTTENSIIFHTTDENYWERDCPYSERYIVGTSTSQAEDSSWKPFIESRFAIYTLRGRFACYAYIPGQSTYYGQGEIIFRPKKSGFNFSSYEIDESLRLYIDLGLENRIDIDFVTNGGKYIYKHFGGNTAVAPNISVVESS